MPTSLRMSSSAVDEGAGARVQRMSCAPFCISFRSFHGLTNLCSLFLKTALQRPRRQGLRLTPRLCNCALSLTVTTYQTHHQSSRMGSLNMIPRGRWLVNLYDPPTLGFINLDPGFSRIRLLQSVPCYLYSGIVFSSSVMTMASPFSTCFRKSGPMLACKRGDQEKPRRTQSGREKGHCLSIFSIVNVTLTAFLQCFSNVNS